MESLRGGITIRDILLADDNLARFCQTHEGRIRPAVKENVRRMLQCRTPELGFHVYACPECGEGELEPIEADPGEQHLGAEE